MIQKPNPTNVRFLVPEVLAQVDALVEPTVEDIGASNVVGDIIADGGVLAGVWDGRPDFRPKIGTDLLTGADSDFSEDSGNWVRGAGVTIAEGKLVFTAVAAGDGAEITLPIGAATYLTSYIADGYSAGAFRIFIGGTGGTVHAADGTFPENVIAGAGDTIRFEAVGGASTFNIDIVTAFHADTWRIDAALERRARADLDFALIDRANIHEAYASAIQSLVDWFAAGTDALPTVALGVTRFVSGLLGEPGPYASYDGLAYTEVADSPQLSFGTEMSIFVRAKNAKATLSALEALCGKFSAVPQREYQFAVTDADKLRLLLSSDGTAVGAKTSDAVVPNINTLQSYGAMLRAGVVDLYIAGGAVDSSDEFGGPPASLHSGTSPFRIADDGSGASLWEGDSKETILYNRGLAPKEWEQMDLGVPVPLPLVVGPDSDMSSDGGRWVNNGFGTFDINSTVPGKMYCLADGGTDTVILSGLLTVGHRYKIEISARLNSGASKTVVAGPGLLTAGGHISFTPTASETEFSGEILAASVDMLIGGLAGALGTSAFEFGGIWITDLGINTTFPLAIDLDGDQTDLTSGVLVAGRMYRIDNFIAGDNFTNVGAASNATGVTFTATGTTPTTWTNSSVLHLLGAVACYQPDGLTATDWYDRSINANHGVHSDVDVWNIPDAQNPGFAYWGLTPFNLRYLFTQVNPNALTALAAFKLGLLMWGKSYSFDYDHDGGHSIGINWPGMSSVTTEGGAVYVEKKFGIRPSWDVTLIAYDDDGFDDIQDFINRVDGSLNPFYYVSDYEATEPIFNRVRLTGGVVPVTYRNGEHSWQGVRFTMVSEGI